MSRAKALKLKSPPSGMAVMVSSRGKTGPDARRASTSSRGFASPFPGASRARRLAKEPRSLSGRISSAREWPIAFSRAIPNVSSARGFQNVPSPAPSESAKKPDEAEDDDGATWAALERRRSSTRPEEGTSPRYRRRGRRTRDLYQQLVPQ
jgi:hypothetical protein